MKVLDRHAASPVVIAVIVVLVGAGCSDEDRASSTTSAGEASTTSSRSSTSNPASSSSSVPVSSSTTVPVEPPTSEPSRPTTTPVTSPPSAAPITPSRSWHLFAEPYFVWGVSTGDRLHVRTDAGASNPIIRSLDPDADGIRVFDPVKWIGRERWKPIRVDGGAGWVNTRYLRPQGPATPEVRGTPNASLSTAGAKVASALRNRDLGALTKLVHPNRGVAFAPHAFVEDDAPVLKKDELIGGADNPAKRIWGYTDGEGAPINETIRQRMTAIGGSTALTSTSVIGLDTRVRTGNSIDNIAERFPGAKVVEYHFGGTAEFRDYDWTSTRLVFDVSAAEPLLIAVVEDTWTV